MSKRNELKAFLWEERTDWSLEPPCPRCDICGEPTSVPNMHEFLIRRGHVPKKKQGCIWHKFNCVLIHQTCHERADGMKEHFKELAIERYGREAIEEWLAGLPLRTKIIL